MKFYLFNLSIHDYEIRGWNKIERFEKHVGGNIGSVHNEVQEKFYYFTKPKSSIFEYENL